MLKEVRDIFILPVLLSLVKLRTTLVDVTILQIPYLPERIKDSTTSMSP